MAKIDKLIKYTAGQKKEFINSLVDLGASKKEANKIANNYRDHVRQMVKDKIAKENLSSTTDLANITKETSRDAFNQGIDSTLNALKEGNLDKLSEMDSVGIFKGTNFHGQFKGKSIPQSTFRRSPTDYEGAMEEANIPKVHDYAHTDGKLDASSGPGPTREMGQGGFGDSTKDAPGSSNIPNTPSSSNAPPPLNNPWGNEVATWDKPNPIDPWNERTKWERGQHHRTKEQTEDIKQRWTASRQRVKDIEEQWNENMASGDYDRNKGWKAMLKGRNVDEVKAHNDARGKYFPKRQQINTELRAAENGVSAGTQELLDKAAGNAKNGKAHEAWAERWSNKLKGGEALIAEAEKTGDWNKVTGFFNEEVKTGDQARAILHDQFNKSLKSGPSPMDYITGYKVPSTAAGLAIAGSVASGIAGGDNGQRTNAQLYSSPF